jgi:hypothetical protein
MSKVIKNVIFAFIIIVVLIGNTILEQYEKSHGIKFAKAITILAPIFIAYYVLYILLKQKNK